MDKADLTDVKPDLEPYFVAICNYRRRMVLRLVDQLGSVSPRDAAEYIAWAESDYDTPDRVDAQVRHAVYVGLRQDHLPKLTGSAILANGDNELEPGPTFGRAMEMLNALDEQLS